MADLLTNILSQENVASFHFSEYRNLENSFYFEKLDIVWWRDFFLQNRSFAYYTAFLYVLTIFGLEKFMKNRKPYNLRLPLICWNLLLGLFSIVGFIRSIQFFRNYIGMGLVGFYQSICVTDYPEPCNVFWGIAFGLSKYVELGDTLFIVLRKRPLKMIQWYHHIATLVAVWVMLPYYEPLGRHFVVMNYGVHSIMYPYFALKVAGINVPKTVSSVITTTQFIQMILGLMLNVATILFIAMGKNCYRSLDSISVFAVVYGSFVILFGRIFYSSVLKRFWNYQNKKLV